MACAWLIRQYIDPNAAFLFIPEGSDALPPGAEPRHPRHAVLPPRRALYVSLLLAAHDLGDRVLARIARIVDEADTVQYVELEPTAPGLDVLCRGLRRVSHDDLEAITHGNLLYDALYAQLEAEEAAGKPNSSVPWGK